YNGVTSLPVTVTVQTATATTTTVTSTATPAAVGSRPTFTATLGPPPATPRPTSGTVTFYDGGVALGTGTVGAAGTATFPPATTANVRAGAHNITATYNGNATFNASTSAPFVQSFLPATTTIQLTVKNNGTLNETYTMSALLGTLSAGVPPTGTITFLDGLNVIGTAGFTTVAAALGGFGIFQAQTSVSNLGVGTHTITATLSDPNYSAPASNAQVITVGKGSQTITFGTLVNKTFGDPDFTVR